MKDCCNSTTKDGIRLCHTNDWRINDASGSLKIIIETHNIPSNDDEIGDNSSKPSKLRGI